MGRNSKNIDYREDYYKGLSKIYFNKILDTLIDFGKLNNEKELILDFGCGVGHLKRRLKRKKIVGYDIIPELSDVKDYKKLKPAKIVLSGVLEHIYLDEIEEIIKNFKKMNKKAELLVFLPTENLISKIAMMLARESHAHDDHVSKYKDINRLIEKYYKNSKRKYLFFRMAQITRYVPKA